MSAAIDELIQILEALAAGTDDRVLAEAARWYARELPDAHWPHAGLVAVLRTELNEPKSAFTDSPDQCWRVQGLISHVRVLTDSLLRQS